MQTHTHTHKHIHTYISFSRTKRYSSIDLISHQCVAVIANLAYIPSIKLALVSRATVSAVAHVARTYSRNRIVFVGKLL